MGEPTALRVNLLGEFRVAVGDRQIPSVAWRRRKAAALVKLLALAPAHRLHREEVIEYLWPELTPEAGTNNLHRTLHLARRILEPDRSPAAAPAYLHLSGDMLALANAGMLAVDAEAFRTAAAHARHTQDPAAFEAAVGLYAGDLLPADRYEDWAAGPREELRATFLRQLLDLARLHEARGARPAAIEALRRLTVWESTHEEAHATLMRLYALAGERQNALRQYELLREALRRGLDADPDPATQRLYRDIRQGRFVAAAPAAGETRIPVPAGRERDDTLPMEVDDPGIGSPEAMANATNLPGHLTSFVGREREMVEVRDLLTATRLLTLTGAGGCGKTRLAAEVAAGLPAEYPDGVWMVELAALADPGLVPQTVASALGVREAAGRPLLTALADHLRPRTALLVLDNCEHLLDACADLVDALLRACPRLSVLATSREVLGIEGELVWRVPSLTVPAPGTDPSTENLAGYGAVRLFVDRARLSQPGFALTPENAAAIARLCRRLDGMPLAIELAAVRVRVLTVEHLADRLDDCLGLLVRGSRTTPPRHQTLQGVMDWSHALLDEPERAVFRRLAVFAGGWTLEAAEAVADLRTEDARSAGQTTPRLERRSGCTTRHFVLDVLARLVDKSLVVVETPDGERRYRLLEPIRQYAARHLLASGEAGRVRDRHRDWYLGLAEAAEPYLQGKEQRRWLDRLELAHDNLRAALAWAVASGDAAGGLRLAGALGRFWQMRSYLSEGRDLLERALAAAEGVPPSPLSGYQGSPGCPADARAKALFAAGLLTHWQSDLPRAAELYGESLALWRQVGDAWRVAYCLNQLGILAEEVGDYPRATALLEESLALRRTIGDRWAIAGTLMILGNAANSQAEYARATALYQECVALLEAVGDRRGAAITLVNLANVANRQGQYREAQALAERGLDLMRAVGDRFLMAEASWNLGLATLALGDEARAVAHYEEALAIQRDHGDRWGSTTTLLCLGKAAHGRGDDRSAAVRFGESLTLRHQLGDHRGVAACFEAIAALLAVRGRCAQAARLFGAAERLREALATPMPLVDRAPYARTVAAVRAALPASDFAAAWGAGRALHGDGAVAGALAAAAAFAAAPDERAAANGAFPLSAREREVAALIGRGLTNRQIADALGMAERTADKHVGNILKKLGLSSRRQVAARFAP